ncbi:MAG: HU family DNA-binding protein [Gemmatimonadetes bacterium]|nr:HU family DNA-binding protein [Gemmatimonadota bacterium]
MTKDEFAASVGDRAGISKKAAKDAIDAIFSTSDGLIAEQLAGGDKFSVVGFGTFGTRDRPARMGRNPRTNQTIHIAASTVPFFKAGKGLRDKVK